MRALISLFVLVCVSCGAPPAKVESPSNVPPPATGQGRVAIALVINGWELWIGNDKEVPEISEDDPSRYPGALVELRAALDHNQFGQWGAEGSTAAVIIYADKPVIRAPMGPLAEITGTKLGTQRDYFGHVGVELVSGIRLALAELAKVQGARRVLIVIGDGNDTNNDAAKAELQNLKKQAEQDGVQTFALIYKSALSAEGNVVSVMVPDVKQITEAKQFDAALAAIRARLNP